MEFDITELDKKILVQTLYSHAAPIGLGKNEYEMRNKRGENVDALTDEDAKEILYEFKYLEAGNGLRILDYHDGKPMKLVFYKNKKSRVLVDSSNYDSRNGKYRFFEAMLNIFSLDEILITKKGYRQFTMNDLPDCLARPKEQEKMFRNLIKNTIRKENKEGKHWTFDETKTQYIPPFFDM